MKIRILTSLALLPLLLLVYLAPPAVFLLLAIGAGALVTWESAGILEAAARQPLRWPALAGVVLLNLSFFRPEQLAPEAALASAVALVVGAVFLLGPGLAGRGEPALAPSASEEPGAAGPGLHATLDSLTGSLALLLLPGFLLSFQVALRGLAAEPAGAGLRPTALLLFLYAVVFGNDSAAYFTGRFLGRIRLAPTISPKKTVEGFLGGLLGGVLLGLAVEWLLPTGLGFLTAAGLAGLLAVAAVFGDLTVSLLKRGAGVKDAGRLLPGHGGLLDRVDGLLFSSPLLYLACSSPALLRGG